MDPVNNCIATNEISQPISDDFLREKYGITKQYSKDYPEDSVIVLSGLRSTEEALQAARETAQTSKKLTNSIIELRESSKELRTQLDSLGESKEKKLQALRKLATSSSEMKAITSNIANIAKRFFNPVRNGFNFLTRHREPLAALPRENQLAIEDTPENTISDTDPTNQTSGDKKKNFVSLLMFFVLSGGLYFAHAGEQKNL
ncbi:MAG: hypothetical protein ACRDAI_03470 [Candidatus Rhabdochlamydia sp.]